MNEENLHHPFRDFKNDDHKNKKSHKRSSSLTFHCPLIPTTISFLLILVLTTSSVSSQGSRLHHSSQACPSREQLKSLVKDPSQDHCFCNTDGFTEGWEINCLRDTNLKGRSSVKHNLHDSNVNLTSVKEVRDVVSTGTVDDHDELIHGFQAAPLSFSIKSSDSKSIEVNCDQSVPDFKPAMFQGKNLFCQLYFNFRNVAKREIRST